MFTNKYNYPVLERQNTSLGRYYKTNGDRPLPSVTTILSGTKDTSFLDSWKSSVGTEKADKILAQATTVGTSLHETLEYHIKGLELPKSSALVKLLSSLIIKKGLVHLTEVWGLESPLYYPELYAGTADCIGIFRGKPAIIDFKNSMREKKKEWIEDYFLQLVAYAEAHNQVYDTNIETGCILMACHTGAYLEFYLDEQEYAHYKGKWFDRVYTYYNKVILE